MLFVLVLLKEESLMMHHSFLGKTVCGIAWLLCALAAIFIGLQVLNIDVFSLNFVQMHLSAFVKPIKIAFGVAGIISLIGLFCHCASCKSGDSCRPSDKHHK